MTFSRAAVVALGFALLWPGASFAHSKNDGMIVPGSTPCEPSSEYLSTMNGEPSPEFCEQWDPDYAFRGHHFCAKPVEGRVPAGTRRRRKRRRSRFCAPSRSKMSYCDEMTPEQREYMEDASSGKLGDLLTYISHEIGNHDQAYCGYNDGFLAYGRPVVATPQNRIEIRNPRRCTSFGTDSMVALLEWLGRQIATEYSADEYRGVRLMVGDISAPRGGCFAGQSGRRGHSSHTSGQDADIGYLEVRAGAAPPEKFPTRFDPHTNWWMIKKIFSNPFACVRRIFLDKKWIRKLSRVAARDPEWQVVRHYIQHVPGHKNHMHIRVGSGPGAPGCGGVIDEPGDEFEDIVADGG